MGAIKTSLLLAALTALFLAVGFLLGGEAGAIIALVLALGMNGFAWWNSSRLVLAMHGARPVTERSAPGLYRMVADLARRAGLPTPRIYIIESDQPNAFATGRSPRDAAVAVTRGLVRELDREELAGVIAHELAHIKNRDTLIMTVAATLAGAIGFLANFFLFFGGTNHRDNPLGLVGSLLLMILAPLAATLVQLAISRAREFEADRVGAAICGDPLWLARALERIEAGARRRPLPSAEAHPATAALFIVHPLTGGQLARLFQTHPPTQERIRRLLALRSAPRPAGRAARRGSVPITRRGPWS